MAAARGYAFLGTAIRIAADDAAAAAWLDEFLTPAFAPWSDGPAGAGVRLTTTAAAREAVAASRPAAAPPPTPAFALDREVVALPSWPIPGGTVLDDAKFGASYVLRGGDVEVVPHRGSTRFRGGLMRVVREIATARALASPDRLQLHAAGFEVDGRAVLIAGAKAAGKTTLLAYVAASAAVRLLANDRAILDRLDVRPVPTIVSVRPGTAALFAERFRRVPAVASAAHLTLAEADAALVARGPAGPDARLKLSPALFARCLGRPLSAGARLAAIVFPEHDADPAGLAVARLPAPEAARRLRAARFGAHREETGPTAFARLAGAPRPAGADDRLLDAVAGGVACLGVRIGAGRYADPSAAARIVAAARAGT